MISLFGLALEDHNFNKMKTSKAFSNDLTFPITHQSSDFHYEFLYELAPPPLWRYLCLPIDSVTNMFIDADGSIAYWS